MCEKSFKKCASRLKNNHQQFPLKAIFNIILTHTGLLQAPFIISIIIIKIVLTPTRGTVIIGVRSMSKFSLNNILYKFACITETRVLRNTRRIQFPKCSENTIFYYSWWGHTCWVTVSRIHLSKHLRLERECVWKQ